MEAVITLTTDFGMTDAYASSMKGVILSINPRATIIDICHSIESQNIAQAAFVRSTAYPYFPQGTIHIVVVDPGVGTERKAVLLVTPSASFVAPDNGVLSYVIAEVAGHCIQRLGTSYEEGGKLLTIIGSSGNLEAVAKNGSDARLPGAKVGDKVKVSFELEGTEK